MLKTTQAVYWYSPDVDDYSRLIMDAMQHTKHNFIIHLDGAVLRREEETYLSGAKLVCIKVDGREVPLYSQRNITSAARIKNWLLLKTDTNGVIVSDNPNDEDLRKIYSAINNHEDWSGRISISGQDYSVNICAEITDLVYIKHNLYLAINSDTNAYILQGPRATKSLGRTRIRV